MNKKYILNQEGAQRKMQRIAYEIWENNIDEKQIILAGIKENGIVIAKNIQQLLEHISSIQVQPITISLDKKMPQEIILNDYADFNDRVVIIVDDVSNSGKTMLYALKPFLEFHPKKIQTLVLVERTHKAFPINPDYVGLSVATTLQEHIHVEVDGDTVKGAWME